MKHKTLMTAFVLLFVAIVAIGQQEEAETFTIAIPRSVTAVMRARIAVEGSANAPDCTAGQSARDGCRETLEQRLLAHVLDWGLLADAITRNRTPESTAKEAELQKVLEEANALRRARIKVEKK